MRKITKFFLCTSGIAVVFAAIYFGGIYTIQNCVDLNKYKNDVFNEVENQTGFKVYAENISIKKTFSPDLNIDLYHTIVLYPDESIFLKLKNINLKVKLLPLLVKKVIIQEAKIERPIINITIYKDLSTSFDKYFSDNKGVKSERNTINGTIINTVFERYKLKIFDENLNKTFILSGDEILLKDINLNGKANFALKGILSEGDKQYLNYDIDITSPLKFKPQKLAFSPFKYIVESNIKGSVYGHVKFDKNHQTHGNIKLTNISLKADGVTLKNNNVNLNFKGDKVNIDAILHTSDNDYAKLVGETSFGKKKYININTTAKNVNLENLSKIVSLVSKCLNIQNKLADLKIKGILNANFDIKSDYKKLKSDGEISIINGLISHKDIPYSVSGVNAYVSLAENNINIKNANAIINKTPIKITGLFKEDVSFDVNAVSENLNLVDIITLFDLKERIPFDIKTGKISFNSNIKGNLNKNYTTENNIKLSNLSLYERQNKISSLINNAEVHLKTNEKSYAGDVTCTKVSTNIDKQKINFDSLKFNFDDKKITIPENIITAPFKLNVSGIINNYNEKLSGSISFNENIEAKKLAEILQPYIKSGYKAKGFIKTFGKIIFENDSVNIKARLKSDKDNYVSYVVINELLNKNSILNIESEIDKEIIKVKDISLYEDTLNSDSILKNGTGIEKLKPIIKTEGKIQQNKELILKDYKISVPEVISFASSFYGGEEISLKTDITLNNKIENPEITGNAKVYKLKLKQYLTAIKNADVSFAKDNIRVTAPDVQVSDSIFNIVADVEPSLSTDNITVNNIQVNSMNLDLNNLFPLFQRERNPFAKTLITIKKGYGAVNNFKVLDIKAKEATADIALNKNILKLSNINAKAYNGYVYGKSEYDIAHGSLGINLEGKRINIRDSLYDLCKLSDNIEGIADFKAEISLFTGSNPSNVIKSISGKMNYNAQDGKMGTLGKFEHYLYAKNILHHGLLNSTFNRITDAIVRENSARFKKSAGTLLFSGGYMIIDEVTTNGENMSIYVKGRHNMLTNQANFTIYGRISDEIKKKLGSLGDYSISDIMNNKNSNKTQIYLTIPYEIIDKIPELYNRSEKTNTFMVNIYGDINSLNAINSFMWVIPGQRKEEDIKKDENNILPDFSDMMPTM